MPFLSRAWNLALDIITLGPIRRFIRWIWDTTFRLYEFLTDCALFAFFYIGAGLTFFWTIIAIACLHFWTIFFLFCREIKDSIQDYVHRRTPRRTMTRPLQPPVSVSPDTLSQRRALAARLGFHPPGRARDSARERRSEVPLFINTVSGRELLPGGLRRASIASWSSASSVPASPQTLSSAHGGGIPGSSRRTPRVAGSVDADHAARTSSVASMDGQGTLTAETNMEKAVRGMFATNGVEAEAGGTDESEDERE